MRVDDSRGGATTPGRLLSLAAGTVRELDPVATVAAAADAGWPAVGLAVDPDHWGPATTRQVRRRLERTGTVVLDVEAVFVTPAGDPGDLVVDVAAEVGARCVLVVGLGIDLPAFTDRFASLQGRAPPRIATLPYDAAALAVALARRPGGPDFSVEAITQPNGFTGVEGLFRFRRDGLSDRALAVPEIRRGQPPVVVRPAPATFDDRPI